MSYTMLMINDDKAYILAVNAGSSSIKAVIYDRQQLSKPLTRAVLENIGETSAALRMTSLNGRFSTKSVAAFDHEAAIELIVDWLEDELAPGSIVGIGHRIVHGGPNHSKPKLIDATLLDDLMTFATFDPVHLPIEIMLVKVLERRMPDAAQVACFDTMFYHDLPKVAQILPLPRKFQQDGLRRYGFHGLSYSYLLSQLGDAAEGRVVMAHLGSGASLTATVKGKPVDTTMSFTPASGIPMSTRAGDLDPGIGWYLHQTHGIDAEQFNTMVNKESGLLGISGTSGDMYTLLQNEGEDEGAAEAVAVFCYQVKKTIGSLAAAMGGIDTLVFSGGMGDDAPKIRERICTGLSFLGIELDLQRNEAMDDVISSHDSRVTMRVVHTDEEQVIAKLTEETINS
jgi:acetate kinase